MTHIARQKSRRVLAEAAEDVAAAGRLFGGSKPPGFTANTEWWMYLLQMLKSDLTECTCPSAVNQEDPVRLAYQAFFGDHGPCYCGVLA